jgi:hypothetical protein
MQHFVDEGGLDTWNALQLLHTIFSLYLVLKSRWKRVVSLVCKKIHTNKQMSDNLLNSIKAPKDHVKAMQEPLATGWWMIGSLAILTTKHLNFFLLLAKGVCNITNTDQKENIIASNLLLPHIFQMDHCQCLLHCRNCKMLAESAHEVVSRQQS